MIPRAKVKLKDHLDKVSIEFNEKVDMLLKRLIDEVKVKMAEDPDADSWSAKVECVDLKSEKINGHYPKLALSIVSDNLKAKGYEIDYQSDSGKIKLTVDREDLE